MSASAPHVLWTEHRTPQGRPYWYHTVERRSVWEKPSELKTPRERALEATPWKEYKSGERSYYVHNITKQSTWTLPDELKRILDQYPADGAAAAAAAQPAPAQHIVASPHNATQSPAFARSPSQATQSLMIAQSAASYDPVSSSSSASLPHRPSAALSPNDAGRYGTSGSNTPRGPSSPPSTHRSSSHTIQNMSGATELNFKGDKAAATSAFTALLAETGVDVDWTWETTMRAIITNPLYKALKTISERKAAFNAYVADLSKKRQAESQERLQALKPSWKSMIESDERIKSYSSFESARKWLGDKREWRQTKGEEEARKLFDEVMRERREGERAAEEKVRSRNKEMLMALLKTFEADVFTRWRDAHRTILESQEYIEDPLLGSMDLTDMLSVFEELMKTIERDADAAQRKEAGLKRRRERQNRDAFKALLASLHAEGRIKPRSTWGDIFPLIKDHPALLACTGQAGSTPVELFFDLVDSLDQELEKQTADALQHVSASGHSVTPTTTLDEFLGWTSGCAVPAATLEQIHTELVGYLADEAQRQAIEEQRKLERKHRHKIEDLRYAFKKISDPPLDLDADFADTILPRVQHLQEYKDAHAEDHRIPTWAWDKFVRRQRDKHAQDSHTTTTISGTSGTKRKVHPDTTASPNQRETIETSKKTRTHDNDDDDHSEPEEGEV